MGKLLLTTDRTDIVLLLISCSPACVFAKWCCRAHSEAIFPRCVPFVPWMLKFRAGNDASIQLNRFLDTSQKSKTNASVASVSSASQFQTITTHYAMLVHNGPFPLLIFTP